MAYNPDQPRDPDGKFAAALIQFDSLAKEATEYDRDLLFMKGDYEKGDGRVVSLHQLGMKDGAYVGDAASADLDMAEDTEVEVSTLEVTQEVVSRDRVLDLIRKGPTAGSSEPIIVVKAGGRNFIIDGHHRAVAARIQQKKFVRAKVFYGEDEDAL